MESTPPPRGHSRAVEDYLKAIYRLQEGEESVSTTALARELARSAASATNMVKSLAEHGLVEHVPYHGFRLTALGETTALRVLRRHRVIESYLIEKLGYTWDTVHREAERLEHAASDRLIDAMAAALGDPPLDPHGSPIPSPEGEVPERVLHRLSELPPGARAVVREVPDQDEGRLRRLKRLGLVLGARIEARGGIGDTEILVFGIDGVVRKVSRKLARMVKVEKSG